MTWPPVTDMRDRNVLSGRRQPPRASGHIDIFGGSTRFDEAEHDQYHEAIEREEEAPEEHVAAAKDELSVATWTWSEARQLLNSLEKAR